ncbi:ATP-binding protein [Streptomyces sp. NPDC024062]|uniref:ATP-binding protein n=1 Tax=unclassified Streptomyces TaxID=2593676 RepID=UPI00343CA1C8
MWVANGQVHAKVHGVGVRLRSFWEGRSVVPVRRDNQPLSGRPVLAAVSFVGDEPVSHARHAARDFVSELQAVHGIPVSERAMGSVQLVVSELVTNARKYAPGPCLLNLELADGAVEIGVWDTESTLPVPQSPDPGRVGQHGLEIVIALSRSFEMHRDPVGKRIKATVPLTDNPT